MNTKYQRNPDPPFIGNDYRKPWPKPEGRWAKIVKALRRFAALAQ